MLQTLLKLGQQGSRNRGEWDDLLKEPTVETSNKKGDAIASYCLPVRFDLDNGTVATGDVSEYTGLDSVRQWFNLAVAGGNNPSVYVCVDGRKNLGQFTKTFFGKSATAEQGELLAELSKYPGLSTTMLADLLRQIVALRDAYMPLVLNEKGDISLRKLTGELKATEQVVMVYAEVKATALGLPDFTPFVRVVEGTMQAVPGYVEFVKLRFLPARATNGVVRLCHATGERHADVGELDIASRYSLNSMFVKTTLHYAPLFAKGDFAKNYQVSDATQVLLERGSKKLLEGYKVSIAGIDHLLLPKLLSTDQTPVESKLPRLSRKADLLFQFQKKMTATIDQLEEEDPDVYWITFLGFESDGNFFKTINLIEDVSQSYFSQVLATFQRLDATWRQAPDLPWERLMGPLEFNLFTVYGMVPVRKGKEKRNAALQLFKQILERRPVARRTVFEHFRALVQCHRYRRYAAYGNVYDKNANAQRTAAQAFDSAVRNAVYQNLALLTILTHFQLLSPMNENQESVPTEPLADVLATPSATQQQEEAFFTRMEYQDPQKALFYLGRALSKVARVQVEKGYKSKPIMDKLNYAGMDLKAIVRLSEDLMEKVRQFQLSKDPKKSPEKALRHFTAYFKHAGWNMHPEEALFFLLSGYSYTIK